MVVVGAQLAVGPSWPWGHRESKVESWRRHDLRALPGGSQRKVVERVPRKPTVRDSVSERTLRSLSYPPEERKGWAMSPGCFTQAAKAKAQNSCQLPLLRTGT